MKSAHDDNTKRRRPVRPVHRTRTWSLRFHHIQITMKKSIKHLQVLKVCILFSLFKNVTNSYIFSFLVCIFKLLQISCVKTVARYLVWQYKHIRFTHAHTKTLANPYDFQMMKVRTWVNREVPIHRKRNDLHCRRLSLQFEVICSTPLARALMFVSERWDISNHNYHNDCYTTILGCLWLTVLTVDGCPTILHFVLDELC